jgi:hypothetical protein
MGEFFSAHAALLSALADTFTELGPACGGHVSTVGECRL